MKPAANKPTTAKAANASKIGRHDCSPLSSAIARILKGSRNARPLGSGGILHIAGAGAFRQAQNVAFAEHNRVDGPRQREEREIKDRVRPCWLSAEAGEKNFSFVNESSRRLLSRSAGVGGMAHCGRLR
jgi:hypothetical protein